MRIVKISAFYHRFIREYYQKYPEALQWPYQKHLNHLLSQGFGWSNHLEKNLAPLGFETMTIVDNAYPLIRKWGGENDIQGSIDELIFKQIQGFKPDVLYIQNSRRFSEQWHKDLLKAVPSIKLKIGSWGSPFSNEDLKVFGRYDLMLTCNPATTQAIRNTGLRSEVLNHAFEPGFSENFSNPSIEKRPEVLFAGSLILAKEFHYGRISFLNTLLEKQIPLQIYSETLPYTHLLAKKTLGLGSKALQNICESLHLRFPKTFYRSLQWNEIRLHDPSYSAIRSKIDPPVYGKEMFSKLAQHQISLNFHIDHSGEYAGNARLFEATGMGSCLVTDQKKNISEFFNPDTEVVTYKSSEECIEKINWLRANPSKLAEIAAAGQKRCLSQHTFKHRAEQFADLVGKALQ